MLNYPAKLYCQLGNQKHNLNPGLSMLKIHSLHFQWLPGQVTLRNTNNKHKALSTSCTCCQPYFKNFFHFKKLLICILAVLGLHCGARAELSCGMWDLSPLTRDRTQSPALQVDSLPSEPLTNLRAGYLFIFKAEVKTELGNKKQTCKSLFSTCSDA